eukprot:1483915-Heterocapsa_arctica.AAC.1
MTAKPDLAELTTPSLGPVIEVADSSSGPSMLDNTVDKHIVIAQATALGLSAHPACVTKEENPVVLI